MGTTRQGVAQKTKRLEEVSRAAAAALDMDGAFYAATRCPQGHGPNDAGGGFERGQVGAVCYSCALADPAYLPPASIQERVPQEHPEYLIGRGQCRPLAQMPEQLDQLAKEWCEARGLAFWVGWNRKSGYWASIARDNDPNHDDGCAEETGDSHGEALAKTLAAAAKLF